MSTSSNRLEVAVRAEKLGKRYRLGQRGGYSTLREAMVRALRRSFPRSDNSAPPQDRSIWALKDVSFEIKPGEIVGVIGRNGAGKSTLLKILSRITEPTEGTAVVCGRVRALLEVGTGFHPELTGRENIYLNGAMLGMKHAEIERKFDEIVAFAEIERFLDTPIKHYSSGMYVRLAFSVAAHLEPEILLVDEVLAVGDAAFQKKCLGRMGEVSRAGRTVLFVSHNMAAVRGFCGRALWIDSGRVAADGTVDEVVSAYMERISDAVGGRGAGSGNVDELQIRRVVLADGEGRPTTQVAPGDDLVVEIQYLAPRRFPRPQFWVSIVSQHGALIAASMLFDGHSPEFVEGPGQLRCRIKALPLVPQAYSVRVGVRAPDGVALLAPTFEAGAFTVAGRMADFGFTGDMADVLCWEASPVILPYEWQLPGGEVIAVPGLGKRVR